MSQAGMVDVLNANPSIPELFVEDTGSAMAVAHIINVYGGEGIDTLGSGNTITISGELATAGVNVAAANIGIAAYDSSMFTVTNGFVQLIGGGSSIDGIFVDSSTTVNPVIADASGDVYVTGAQVASALVGAKVIKTNSLSANHWTIQIQQSGTSLLQNTDLNGVAHFNSGQFSIANGFVSLLGGSQAMDSFKPDSGTDPVVPDVNGLVVMAGSGSITTVGSLNTLTTQLTGLTNHAVLVGAGTTTITKLSVGTNGQVLIGATTADPAFATLTSSDSSISFTTGANTLSLQVAGGSTVIKTITGNTGGAEVPSSGNFNILGTGSITVAGSANTETVQLTGLTNHAIQIGAGTATLTQLAIGSTGQVLQANTTADPTWSTATFPSTATSTGTILRADGTNWLATTSTYPNTNAISTLLYASSANVMSALTTAIDGLLITSHTGVPSILAGPGTTGQVLQSNAAAAPSFSTASYPSTTTINQLLYSSAANTVTGLATANRAVLTTGTTGIPVLTALATDGQLIIGSTAGSPAAATLSAGTGISITNGSNSITIAATSGGFTWTDATNATYTLAAENGYVTDRGGGVTYTLPASGTLGDEIIIVGKLGLATVTPNANQQIVMGSASGTVGVTGTAVATNAGDCMTLICITAGASCVFRSNSYVGNWILT